MDSLLLKISKGDAEKVLLHPAIYETISEDGMDGWENPDGPLYLCGYVPDLIGCFIIHKQSKATVDVHVQVLPEYRRIYAEQFGREVINWTWANTEAMKMVAQIPFLYPNVMEFAKRMGFEVEGVNVASFIKHGQLHDQWYMGLRR